MFGLATPRDRAICKSEVLQLPEQAECCISARVEIAEEPDWTAAKSPAGIAKRQTRDERAKSCLFQTQQRGLHQFLCRRQLRPMIKGMNNHVVETDFVGD